VRNYQGRNLAKKRATDVLTPARRSNLMSRIRSSGSKMEADFVAALKARCREPFAINDRAVFGTPDVAFDRAKLCVFLDSDFWHGWQYPRWKHLLKSSFWRQKIENNRARDSKVTRNLRRQGWTVIRVWEHNLRGKKERVLSAIISAVRPRRGIPSSGKP